jgi:hypothetical protein
VTIGWKILRTIAVMTAVGGFVVDWNRAPVQPVLAAARPLP